MVNWFIFTINSWNGKNSHIKGDYRFVVILYIEYKLMAIPFTEGLGWSFTDAIVVHPIMYALSIILCS